MEDRDGNRNDDRSPLRAFCNALSPGWPESMRWCQPEVAGERRYICPACCRCRWHACGAHADGSPDCLHCYFSLEATRDGESVEADEARPLARSAAPSHG
jgi:hypothetical protein